MTDPRHTPDGCQSVETRMSDLMGTGPVAEAARWHLEAGGSRVRATLALRAADRAGLADPQATAIAAACELLHNASLVHDDLQDRDQTRRGQPALWVQYGTDTAICAGDLMISAAYAALADLGPQAGPAMSRAHRAIAATIAGQATDITAAPDCTMEAYRSIAAAKSGPLLALPVELVLISAGADEAAMRTAEDAMSHLALAYQITDDLSDRDRDRAAGSPNICLVLEAADVSPAEATARAHRIAQDALRAAHHSAATLPHDLSGAIAPLVRSLETHLPEACHAA